MRPLTFRSKVILGCALAVAVVGGVAFAVWPWEPLYEGKPFSYWLDCLPATLDDDRLFHDSLNVADLTNRAAFSVTEVKAQSAVNEVGPRCLPVLVERLQLRDTRLTRLRQRMIIWSSLHGFSKRKRFPTPESKRRQAVTALVYLGNAAGPIVPKVLTLAKFDPDPGVRASALQVLRHLSPADYAQVAGQTNALSAR